MPYQMIKIGEAFLFSIFSLLTVVAAFRDSHQLTASRRREPNNVQCFKNSDCLSDCCISNNGWVGVCVGKPQIGQICGLFTTANSGNNNMFGQASSGNSNPWSWSYGGILGNLLMNGGGGGTAANGAVQPQPSARPGNAQNNGAWVADLSALLSNNPSGSGARDPYEASGMMQGYHHHGGAGGGGMDYSGPGGANAGYGHQGGHHGGNNGFSMNSFDLSSLKYGNKFGKRFDVGLYG